MNNGEISFGVREAEEIGIARSVASRHVLAILIERGFLRYRARLPGLTSEAGRRGQRLTGEPCRGVRKCLRRPSEFAARHRREPPNG